MERCRNDLKTQKRVHIAALLFPRLTVSGFLRLTQTFQLIDLSVLVEGTRATPTSWLDYKTIYFTAHLTITHMPPTALCFIFHMLFYYIVFYHILSLYLAAALFYVSDSFLHTHTVYIL